MKQRSPLAWQVAALGLLCAMTVTVCAQAVKLVVIATDKAQDPVADLLTVELSKRPGVVVLERAEVNRVLNEQKLSTVVGGDYVKLGQLLSGDGLLVLEMQLRDGKKVLVARLVAVKPGVVLAVETAPWPIQDAAEWCRLLARGFSIMYPKLTVLTKDAITISVLNLRSALNTPEEQTLEKELKLMLIHRLTREREVFVLERQRLREVFFEQEIRPEVESSFWTGRYLIEGTLGKKGFDRNRVTVSARLVSPQGGAPIQFEEEGPRGDQAAIVESLTTTILAGLHVNRGMRVSSEI